ncbi:MAG TPA: cysteine--tRNA ligase [Actinotalea sp.]|nr:cysteine--tRNA ligase [Actinotalea sp.]
MSLHLFDSSTRTTSALVPLRAGEVGLYVCGPTVQSSPHVGHLRTAVAFDVLVRWLRRSGYRVTLIRNVTDIDDKILAKSAAAGEPWWAWALTHEREFEAAHDALGVLRPTYEPRATGHVTEMVELMSRLVASGHAYTTGPGDVWFDVRAFPGYGALTNQRPEDLPPADDDATAAEADDPASGAATGKRDPLDFALWKAPKAGDPETASWPTPFGRGRPGWHLECSAMAQRYLGDTFDIHGGGLDLRFPHHENEQAQSHAAGHGFARRWMHSAWVTQGGAKMSKSLGNSLLVSVVLSQVRPVVLRYALTAVHYRSMLEFGPETLHEAEATWNRLSGFVRRAAERVGPGQASGPLPAEFTAAMDDDLNVSAALAVVHEHLRRGNTALADGDLPEVTAALGAVRGMLDVLGLDPVAWETGAQDGQQTRAALDALDVLVQAELTVRATARAARDWAAADAVRDRLTAAGIAVQDSPTGARWSLVHDQED